MVPEILGAAAQKELTQTFGRVLGSPASELGAYIADKIRALRYNSLLRIVENAEKKAKERHLHLKMPPVKFFVPFCESASLEEEDDVTSGSLSDLWANLLVSAASEYDPRHLMFLRVLKELTSNESRFIDLIVNKSRAFINLKPMSWSGYEESPYLTPYTFDIFFDRLNPPVPPEDLLEYVVDCLECPGVRFLDGSLVPVDEQGYPDPGNGYMIGVHDVDRPNTDIAMNVLEGLNLGRVIYLENHRSRAYPDFAISLTYFRLSELGVALLNACNFQLNDKEFREVVETD
jgi:hypothetical protein